MMKKALIAAITAPLLMSVAAAAESTPVANSPVVARAESMNDGLVIGRPYRTTRDFFMPAIATYPSGQTVPGAADITPGTEFWVLSADPQNGTVTIGVDDSPGGQVISHLTVNEMDLEQTNFEERPKSEFATFEEEEMPDDGTDLYSDDGSYSAFKSRRGGYSKPRKKTPSCYADVKHWLLRRRLVRSYPPGAAAYMGYNVLRSSYGFHPAAFTEKLPVGAVCVSQGGRFSCGSQKCGHIAVKIGPNQWYGAGVHPSPLLSNHYNLRCLVK